MSSLLFLFHWLTMTLQLGKLLTLSTDLIDSWAEDSEAGIFH